MRKRLSRVYRRLVPFRLRLYPIAIVIGPTLWFMLGLVLFRAQLPAELWPRESVIETREWVKEVLAVITMVSAFLVAFGHAFMRPVVLALGSSMAFGVSGAVLIGVIDLFRSSDFLWPQLLFALVIWSVLTGSWLVSLIENKSVGGAYTKAPV